MAGVYEAEYIYAQAHPKIPECSRLLALAYLYSKRQEGATLGLIEEAAKEVNKMMVLTGQAQVKKR